MRFCVRTAHKVEMLEATQHFEEVAVRFNNAVLVGLGLTAFLLGLFIWLGGLGLKKTLLALVGAVAGGVCGSLASGRNLVLTIIAAATAAAIAVIFERVFITILAAALVAGFAIIALTRPYPAKTERAAPINRYEIQNHAGPYTARQTVQILSTYLHDIATDIKSACLQIPLYNWLIVAALAAVPIALAFFSSPLTSAFCCAALGTISVFAGMILLLLYKGSAPLGSICHRVPFYTLVFLVMIAFGTAEQLVLCQHNSKKQAAKKQTTKPKQQRELTKKLNWRRS
ncbi:MAG: hypothetical protein ACYSTJ_05745 [Planctomycetota bacterium]